MKTFLLIGDDRYFYEALKKQIELNERFLLEFQLVCEALLNLFPKHASGIEGF